MNINYKMINVCAGGGHGSIDMTPGPTFFINVEEFRPKLAEISAMSNREKAILHLALHIDANGLTLAQAREELVAVAGLDLVI